MQDKILRSRVIRLAYANPEIRQHLLPLLKTASVTWEDIPKGDISPEQLADIWEMFKASYQKIGLKVSSIGEMLADYNVWRLAFDGDRMVAFSVGTRTEFGVKSGLAGSDGSSEGKAAIKEFLSTVYKQPGNYSEVSHAVEHIAVKSGVPVVCAAYVPTVLKKQIAPSGDGIHYKRNISGVGLVEKLMVGHPRGIPTTSPHGPVCPMVEAGRQALDFEEDTRVDVDAHITCLTCDF